MKSFSANMFKLKPLVWIAAVLFGVGAAVLFTSLAPWLAIAFLAAAVFILAVFRNPIYGLILVVFLLPFERIGSVEVAGMTLRLSQVIALATIIAWLVYCLARKKFAWARNPLIFPLSFFIVANLFSLYNTENMGRSLLVLALTLFVIIVSVVVPNIIKTKKHLIWTTTALIISGGVVALFGLYQFAGEMIGLPAYLTGLREHYTSIVFGFPRLQGTALEPLYFANYLLIPISVALAWFWYRVSRFKNWFLVAIIVVALIAFILTLSRGGYLGLIASLVALAVTMPKSVFKPINVVIGAAVIVLVLWGAIQFLQYSGFKAVDIFVEHATETSQSEDVSIKERVDTIEEAEKAYRAHPVIGIGVGAFGPYVNPSNYNPPEGGWLIVNNETLELMAETGIAGLLTFYLVVFVLIWTSVVWIRRAEDKFLKATLIGLLAAFIGIIAQYQTFSILYILHVWVLVGLIIATQNVIRRMLNSSSVET